MQCPSCHGTQSQAHFLPSLQLWVTLFDVTAALNSTFHRHCSSSRIFSKLIFLKKSRRVDRQGIELEPFGRESDTLTTVLILQLKTSYVYRNTRWVGIKRTANALKFEIPSSTIQNHLTMIHANCFDFFFIYIYHSAWKNVYYWFLILYRIARKKAIRKNVIK